jgi:hypothetical protein
MGDHRFRMFENRVLGRIFGIYEHSKRTEEVT